MEYRRVTGGGVPGFLRRAAGILLAAVMILSSLPMSFAITVGTTKKGDPVELHEVRFILNHRGFDFNGGYFELSGKNLKDQPVYVRIGGEAESIGTRTINTDELIIIKLTKEEVQRFSGEIIVGGTSIDLAITDFPNIQSADRASVIIDNVPADTITFFGSNLNRITGDIKGVYGAGTDLGGQLTGANAAIAPDGGRITLTNPKAPGRKGYQDIYIRRITDATASKPRVRIEYQYIDAFRILEKMDSGNVTMFPNTGSKGDELYLESKSFNASNAYEVYFLKTLNGSDRPSAVNKAKFVSLGIDVDGTLPQGGKDILTVKVPEHPNFEAGTYYVLLTKIQNGQIIAEAPVKVSADAGAVEDTFAVIQAGFGPKIVAIHPPKGPDTGSNVEIKAKNVISLNIPDLAGGDTSTFEIKSPDLAEKLSIEYKNTATPLKYKDKPVNVTRNIQITVGKRVKFSRENITSGVQDQFIIRTQRVDDAEVSPKRDVIVEMETVIEEKAAPHKKYVFKQQVVVKNGYEFIPSTYAPIVDSVTPHVIQTEKTQIAGVDYYKTDKKLLISIKGEKFFVYRYYDNNGNPIAVKPSILIKQDSANTLNTHYQIALLPNEETDKIKYST
ncbi:MAG: hypothetical protein Q4A41_03730, partial [Bacillota bacterium]|nr:hypothetical protein [Bacillota bacterium]